MLLQQFRHREHGHDLRIKANHRLGGSRPLLRRERAFILCLPADPVAPGDTAVNVVSLEMNSIMLPRSLSNETEIESG